MIEEREIGEREIIAGVGGRRRAAVAPGAARCSPAAANCARSPGAEPFTDRSQHAARRSASSHGRTRFRAIGGSRMRMRKKSCGRRGAPRRWPRPRRAVAVGQSRPDKVAQLASKIDASKPKNVILLVGDGMGDSEVTLGRYYGKGAAGRLNMDRLPFRGSSIHYVLRPGPGPTYQPNYVGDSAPTATAWSTGKRTQDGRLVAGPVRGRQHPRPERGLRTYMEIAPRPRQGDRQRVDRRDHRRDAGRRRARTSPSAPARARPTRGPRARPRPRRRRRRPGLDRRAAGRRGLRPRTSAAAAPATSSRSTAGGTHERDRLRDGQGLHVRRHQGRARRRHDARATGSARCSACSTRAT